MEWRKTREAASYTLNCITLKLSQKEEEDAMHKVFRPQESGVRSVTFRVLRKCAFSPGWRTLWLCNYRLFRVMKGRAKRRFLSFLGKLLGSDTNYKDQQESFLHLAVAGESWTCIQISPLQLPGQCDSIRSFGFSFCILEIIYFTTFKIQGGIIWINVWSVWYSLSTRRLLFHKQTFHLHSMGQLLYRLRRLSKIGTM